MKIEGSLDHNIKITTTQVMKIAAISLAASLFIIVVKKIIG